MQKQYLCFIRLKCIHLKWLKPFFTYQAEVKWKLATKASSAEFLMSSTVRERLHFCNRRQLKALCQALVSLLSWTVRTALPRGSLPHFCHRSVTWWNCWLSKIESNPGYFRMRGEIGSELCQ